MKKISIVSNVTSQDAIRIINVLPNWLRTFNNYIEEILLIYDKKPVEGRISILHKMASPNKSLNSFLNKILGVDPRIKIVDLDYGISKEILKKWFTKNAHPIRCQAGTPIYALIYGIEKSKSEYVFKVDCDMIFWDKGFVESSIEELLKNDFDTIEICKTGLTNNEFSTRAFYLNKKVFYNKLPMNAYKLDILRIIHRKINRRPVYLALEQMIQKEIDKNKIKRKVFPRELGYSMHIPVLDNFNLPDIQKIIQNFTIGSIPEKQLLNSENFCMDFWDHT